MSQPESIPPASSPNARGRSPIQNSPRSASIARLASPIPTGPASFKDQTRSPSEEQHHHTESTIEDTTHLLPSSSSHRSPARHQQHPISSPPSGPGVSVLSSALRTKPSNLSGRHAFDDSPSAIDPSAQSTTAATPTLGPRGTYGSIDRTAALADPVSLSNSPALLGDPDVIKKYLVDPASMSPAQRAALTQPHHPHHQATTSTGAAARKDDPPSREEVEEPEEFSSLQLQGGDITRAIYRWQEQAEAEVATMGKLQRSRSVQVVKQVAKPGQYYDATALQQPGGFRRDYILREAAESPSRGDPGSSSRRSSAQVGAGRYGATTAGSTAGVSVSGPVIHTSSFFEFLTLYGHFAGEDLVDADDDEDDDSPHGAGSEDDDEGDDADEQSSLIPKMLRHKKRGRDKKKPSQKQHKSSAKGAALLLLKSFVGTGVLFMPKAYLNGGMLFSNLVLLAVAGISYYCFVLLVTTRLKVQHSFGDMGYTLYGPVMRSLINMSLVLSQVGFASAYLVFVSEGLQSFVLAVTDCRVRIGVPFFILMQMIIFLPLSLYRNINNIQKLALAADVFIVAGLVYIFCFDAVVLAHQHGVADIRLFNPETWTLFIGTAIFTFEGIGLIIPIQTGMKDPRKFPKVLSIVMVIITVIFVGMGAMSYAAFGSATRTVIILNMPQDSRAVNAVQFIYSVAIMLSTPLQIYPAIEITSQQIFPRTRSGKTSMSVKWQKNVFRFAMVALCAVIAWLGANDLDKFVSLVGSFACIPLVYIYPPMMHARAIATKTWQVVVDGLLVVLGVVVMVYTTVLTARSWASGHQSRPPGFCD